MSLILFHVQNASGHPIAGALIQGVGNVHGAWQGVTNDCGDFPAMLAADHYELRVSASGHPTRTLPADLADSGIVTIGLEGASFHPAPREWRGNFCGVRVPGLPAVSGGATDPSLVLSFFYDRYSAEDRQKIRAAWKAREQTHILLSWPDSRSVGCEPQQFLSYCQELIADGFFPCVMLASKDHDPADVPAITNALVPVLELLVGVVPAFCIGWELSLWLSPTQVQQLIDAVTLQTLAQVGTRNFVHFQQGYFAFQQPGHTTADFWKANVGKLTGVLHQRDLSWDKPMYQARIVDCLQRFAGQFNFPSDSGFGHPFDFVAFEITAATAFNGEMSEDEQNSWGQTAIDTEPVGAVQVQGSGNGL